MKLKGIHYTKCYRICATWAWVEVVGDFCAVSAAISSSVVGGRGRGRGRRCISALATIEAPQSKIVVSGRNRNLKQTSLCMMTHETEKHMFLFARSRDCATAGAPEETLNNQSIIRSRDCVWVAAR